MTLIVVADRAAPELVDAAPIADDATPAACMNIRRETSDITELPESSIADWFNTKVSRKNRESDVSRQPAETMPTALRVRPSGSVPPREATHGSLAEKVERQLLRFRRVGRKVVAVVNSAAVRCGPAHCSAR